MLKDDQIRLQHMLDVAALEDVLDGQLRVLYHWIIYPILHFHARKILSLSLSLETLTFSPLLAPPLILQAFSL